jgi:hypothetical protein
VSLGRFAFLGGFYCILVGFLWVLLDLGVFWWVLVHCGVLWLVGSGGFGWVWVDSGD